jgi:hypothetical protein
VWLGPVVLAPDVKHENTGNEEEGHHQDGHGANLNKTHNRIREKNLILIDTYSHVQSDGNLLNATY